MKTVIGLFSKDENVQRSIDRLQEAGLARDNIKVLIFEDMVAELLKGQQSVVLTKYVGWGAIISVFVFALYELIGRICDCGISIYGFRIELDRLVLFIIIGVVLGVLIGYLTGVEHLEGSIRPYTWNVHQGGKVMAVRTNDELETTVANILHQENGVAIKTLETRVGHFWHKAPRQGY